MKKYFKIYTLLMFGFILSGCAGKRTSVQMQPGLTLLSEDIKNEIKNLSRTVVGMNTNVKYEILTYNYLKVNGEFVPDPESPLKYKLASTIGEGGIVVTEDDKTLSGGGLILEMDHESKTYTILTSNHLVAPQEITDIFYPDENGSETDILFTRYIVKEVAIGVRGYNNWLTKASLVANDPKNDLAIIKVQTTSMLGRVYPNDLGYDMDLDWGDWVFLFGFPKGIKQMTGGWVSKAPYRNTLAVDAVVKFGYSGGPVFAINKENAKLLFVGMIKSVPRSTMEYIAPDGTLPMGYRLSPYEIENLFVKREHMVEYGTAYFVDANTIKRFLNSHRSRIEKSGAHLSNKYYGN